MAPDRMNRLSLPGLIKAGEASSQLEHTGVWQVSAPVWYGAGALRDIFDCREPLATRRIAADLCGDLRIVCRVPLYARSKRTSPNQRKRVRAGP